MRTEIDLHRECLSTYDRWWDAVVLAHRHPTLQNLRERDRISKRFRDVRREYTRAFASERFGVTPPVRKSR